MRTCKGHEVPPRNETGLRGDLSPVFGYVTAPSPTIMNVNSDGVSDSHHMVHFPSIQNDTVYCGC